MDNVTCYYILQCKLCTENNKDMYAKFNNNSDPISDNAVSIKYFLLMGKVYFSIDLKSF